MQEQLKRLLQAEKNRETIKVQIYLDTDYRCHTIDTGGLASIEADFFNGKCKTFIEGYRCIPAGESWTREDGTVFAGEMIAPAEDSRLLETAQASYEEALATNADALAALEILGVNP